MKSILIGSVGAAALLAALPLSATVISYTDSATWSAATSSITQISFGNVPNNSFTDYSTSTGLVSGGVDFIGKYAQYSSYQLEVVGSSFGGGYYNFGTTSSVRSPVYDRAQGSNTVPYIHVVLPANTTAFSAGLSTVSPNSLTYQVTLSGGQTYTVPTAAAPTSTFYGITSDSPIAYVDFTVLGTQYNGGTFGLINSFSVGTSTAAGSGGGTQAPADTPEVATLLMIGGGLLFFRSMRKYGTNFTAA